MNRLENISKERKTKKLTKEEGFDMFTQFSYLIAKYSQERKELMEQQHSKWLLIHIWRRKKEFTKLIDKFDEKWRRHAKKNGFRPEMFLEAIRTM